MRENGGKKVGVMLVNLGTTETLSWWGIFKFLASFLTDRRVIKLPRLFWLPLLYGVILPLRCHKLLHSYRGIWHKESNMSPLRYYTQQQAVKLFQKMANQNVCVTWAMRYGQPGIAEGLKELAAQGCGKVVFFPLYPQYARSTTESSLDALFKNLPHYSSKLNVSIVPPYWQHPAYMQAMMTSVDKTLKTLENAPDAVLISFHSLPKKEIKEGDPYQQQCEATAELLAKGLKEKIPHAGIYTSYQSRFGINRWLEPSTFDMVVKLAQQGVKHLLVLSPGFSSDCLETLEELDETVKDLFLKSGGVSYGRTPCLNDSPEGIDMLEKIVRDAVMCSEDCPALEAE